MQPDPAKVEVIKKAKAPINLDVLNSFVCMTSWQDIFLMRFAELVRPLRDLANTKGPFTWTDYHQEVFEEIKNRLSEHCLNNYFRLDCKTYLFTDAGKKSNDPKNNHGGFSAILAQTDENGNYLPIHFASRSISPVESRYSQVEIESRALRWGLDKFRYYLEGIRHVTCYVDCKSLLPIFNNDTNRECSARINRQRLACQDLPIELVHLDGKNMPADFLSRERTEENDASAEDINDMDCSDQLEAHLVRMVTTSDLDDDVKPMALSLIREHTKKDPILQFVKTRIENRDWYKHRNDPRIKTDFYGIRNELWVIDGLIIRGEQRIVLPSDLHSQATALVHKLAHVGMTNTESLLTSRFWFPGYSTIVRAEVDWCDTCSKTIISKRKEPLGDTVTVVLRTNGTPQFLDLHFGLYSQNHLYKLCTSF